MFKHTDRGLYAATKSLQLPKPSRSLMCLFFSTQTTHFLDTDFLNAGLLKLHHIFGTVVAAIRSEFLGLYVETAFGLAQRPKQFRSVAGIAPVNFIVKDQSRTILDQLKRAPKFHRLIKFPLTDGPRFRVIKRNDPLGDRLLSLKLLLGLAENGLSQLDLFAKPLLELNRTIGCERPSAWKALPLCSIVCLASQATFLRIFRPFSLRSLGLALAVDSS